MASARATIDVGGGTATGETKITRQAIGIRHTF
jgi:hypothetical protein